MYLKHVENGEIYPYSPIWAMSKKFELYESLMELEERYEKDELALLMRFPKSVLTKEIAECELERLLTDKEYKKLLKRLFNG